jgi:hypothetical protein
MTSSLKSRAFGLVACQRLTAVGRSVTSTRIDPSAALVHENFGRGRFARIDW